MMKYMKLKSTDYWSKVVSPVLDAYNSPHSTTKIAPNIVNKDKEIQVLMNRKKEEEKSKKGGLVSMETHQVEDANRGLYTVDGSLHTREDLQLVKGNVIKHLPRLKHNKY